MVVHSTIVYAPLLLARRGDWNADQRLRDVVLLDPAHSEGQATLGSSYPRAGQESRVVKMAAAAGGEEPVDDGSYGLPRTLLLCRRRFGRDAGRSVGGSSLQRWLVRQRQLHRPQQPRRHP